MTHPSTELLLAHVAGNLKGPFAVLVGSHLALCAVCRADRQRLEALGGALLDGIPEEGRPEQGLEATLARLNEPAVPAAPVAADRDEESVQRLPAPLRRFVREPLSALPWRKVTRGLSLVKFSGAEVAGLSVHLLLSRPGQSLPLHQHPGTEMTLVLSGGLSVGGGRYERGDVMIADASDIHRPVTEPGEDCLSFVVADGPIRFTEIIPRLWQMIARY